MATMVAKRRTAGGTGATTVVRGSTGRFTKVYKGDFANSSAAKSAGYGAQRFGTRDAKRRDLRSAFGLAAG